MPLAQAQLLFGRDQAVDFIEIKLTDPDNAPGLKPALAAAAGPGADRHRLDRAATAPTSAPWRSSATSCA